MNVNTANISDNNTFKFRSVPTMPAGFLDVMYKGQRIAIINGLSAPLEWVGANGINVPVKVINQLESIVKRNLNKN